MQYAAVQLFVARAQAVQPAFDLLVRARREAYSASYDALRAELQGWRDATCPVR